MTRLLYRTPSISDREKTSAPDSKRKIQGSVTIEAALTIPIFLFAVLCLVYLFEIQAISFSIRTAAQGAAKIAAEEAAVIPVCNPVKFQADLINLIGTDRLDRSIVVGGSRGIHCFTTYYDSKEEVLKVKVGYTLRLPFPEYTGIRIKQEQGFQIKAWTGYAEHNGEETDEEIVYITENGFVYHTDYHCSYLQPSVQFVPVSAVENFRNESGGIYHACERCVHGESMSGVYITNYGTKYHNSLSCSGLKRSIRAVKKSEVIGKGACSKCGK